MDRRKMIVSFAAMLFGGCGLELAGSIGLDRGPARVETNEGASEAGPDGGPHAPPHTMDAGDGGDGDAALRCGAALVASCLSCTEGIFLCAETGACVSDCKTKCSAPIECMACEASGKTLAAAVCVTPDAAASCTEAPLARCRCADETECFGRRQVCADGGCRACGEEGSNKLLCKGPPVKACDDDGSGKVEDEYTCH